MDHTINMNLLPITPILLVYTLLLFNTNDVCAYTQKDLYNLIDNLFATYKREVRPTLEGNATELIVDVFLLAIQDLDERAQEFKTSLIIQTGWEDDFLRWNSSDYGGIEYIFYEQSAIWLPDIVVQNSVESQKQLGYDENKVQIFSDGRIYWLPSQVVKSGCDIDVTYYPFDTQVCTISIGTWMSPDTDIVINAESGSEGFDMSRYGVSGTWDVVSLNISTVILNDGNTRVNYLITLRRLSAYYVLNIVLPVVFLSFTTSMVFMLPADAGEKIGMCITVLLAYAVYLTIIAENMPQTSRHISYLAVYLALLLGLTALGVVLSVLVLHLHHKPQEVEIGRRTTAMTRKIRHCLRMTRKSSLSAAAEGVDLSQRESVLGGPKSPKTLTKKQLSKVSPAQDGSEPVAPSAYCKSCQEEEEEITWPKVAEAVDRVLFCLTSLFIIVITLVFFCILVSGSS